MVKSILVGPLRLFLLIVVVFIVHQIVIRQPLKNYGLDYVVKRIVLYGSAILLLIFGMIQMNMYDIFSLLGLFLLFFFLLYLGNPFNNNLVQKKKHFLLVFFRFMEKNLNLKKIADKILIFFKFKRLNLLIFSAFGTSLVIFFSRYFFLNNDIYTLSNIWIRNLETIKNFNSNNWFSSNINIIGELALLNFYAKITNISEEMAIHSFGLLENFFLGIVIYWILVKITHSKYIAPICGVLFFALFYQYLPLNINHVLEHNPLYLALCFGLPSMLFIIKPKLLNRDKKKYFISMTILFMAVSLISFYVTFILIPLFIILSLPFNSKKTWSYTYRGVSAYVISTLITLSIHYILCTLKNVSFNDFFLRNFILTDYYTFSPQITLSLENLAFACRIVGLILLLIYGATYLKKSKKWKTTIVFILMFNLFFLLVLTNLSLLDKDLYYQTLPIFMSLLIGLLVGVIVLFLKQYIKKNRWSIGVIAGCLFIGFYIVSSLDIGFYSKNLKKTPQLKTNLLKVYSNLSKNRMPYSYAVVNQTYGLSMSKNAHYYINYNDFTNNYIQKDENYQRFKEDEIFLKENPQYILPKSIFVFVANPSENVENNDLITPTILSTKIEKQINLLKEKGRKVNIYFSDSTLTVYEIVNSDKASKLSDLIFKI